MKRFLPTLASCLLFLLLVPRVPAQEPETPVSQPTNRMLREQSPYLRQHANDAVAWYAWGPAAFEKARREKKPIFLSSGYAACHWCHVMQRESFQNAEIARILNSSFVPIKLDREERPDVDRIYMDACQALNQRGGWPLSAFLTPDRKPFFVATYLPPETFKAICERIATSWEKEHDVLVTQADRIVAYLRGVQERHVGGELPSRELLAQAADALAADEDESNGGFGTAPKFPRPSAPLFLLRQASRSGKASEATPVRRLLDALLRGGIRDHLAGGFHRYSTDARWLVPHFEKMLYDQALLAVLFLEGYQVWKDERYGLAVREILDYCLRDLVTQEGGFIAALDADAEHEEGLTYVWTLAELRAALAPAEAAALAIWCNASEEGNWEKGRNILHAALPQERVAARLDKPLEETREILASARRKLLAARAAKPQPLRDTKVLTGWNALMASALARAGVALDEPRYVEQARRVLRLIEARLRRPDGRLLRSLAGGRSRHLAELQDHAALLVAYLDMHEATLEQAWLEKASALAELVQAAFGREEGGFVDSRADDLIYNTREIYDGAWPSGTSLMLVGLARLGVLKGDRALLERARTCFSEVALAVARSPRGAPWSLVALDLLHGPTARVELHGRQDSPQARALLEPLRKDYHPAVTLTRVSSKGDEAPRAVVCVGKTCLEPATSAEELRARLAKALAPPPLKDEK